MRIDFFKTALLLAFAFGAAPAFGQSKPQVINIPLSQPGEPITLEISILSAHIEVIGEDRADAEISVSVQEGSRKIITPSGTKELSIGAYAFEVDEEDNHITVDTDWRANKVTVIARIPRRADLVLETTNDGVILVSNVTGSHQFENTNGPITATGISGSVIAESVNDDISVSFVDIDDTSAMVFGTINGTIAVGLPADAAVQLHIDSSNGEIYSDFEVDVEQSEPVIERTDERGGVVVRVESVIIANINGGGAIIKIKSLNGDIQINKSGN